MFIVIDDRVFNVNDISLVEPNAEDNTLVLYFCGDPEATTTVHYDSTEDMVKGLSAIIDITGAKTVPGRFEE